MEDSEDESVRYLQRFMQNDQKLREKKEKNNNLGIASILLGILLIVGNIFVLASSILCWTDSFQIILVLFGFPTSVGGLINDKSKKFAAIGFLLFIIGFIFLVIVLDYLQATFGWCPTL